VDQPHPAPGEVGSENAAEVSSAGEREDLPALMALPAWAQDVAAEAHAQMDREFGPGQLEEELLESSDSDMDVPPRLPGPGFTPAAAVRRRAPPRASSGRDIDSDLRAFGAQLHAVAQSSFAERTPPGEASHVPARLGSHTAATAAVVELAARRLPAATVGGRAQTNPNPNPDPRP
jgi:hypothetical protein